MRPHAALLLGALVLLGGCLGGAGITDGGTDGQTATETDVTTTEATIAESGDSQTDATTEETTTLPATTDVEENVTATFVVEENENPTVSLEVADEQEERTKGLMYRTSLPENHGMVFVYGDASTKSFWMKNTLVPLDIIFVAPNGTVLNVEHANTQPDADDSELDSYQSDGDAKYVVELKRGFANRTGVEAGTELRFNDSAPDAEGGLW